MGHVLQDVGHTPVSTVTAKQLSKAEKYSSVFGGKPISAKEYTSMVTQSKSQTWWSSRGFLHDSSFAQEEIILPKGHIFHRISKTAETGFGDATYSLHSLEDYNRYIGSFRQEKGIGATLHHITWEAKEEIRIPTLARRLETMKETLQELAPHKVVTDAEALNYYKNQCGGGWYGNANQLFFQKLSSQGFHGIIDDMDAGVLGQSPLVLFSPGSFTDKVSQLITSVDIQKAESAILEITNRKL